MSRCFQRFLKFIKSGTQNLKTESLVYWIECSTIWVACQSRRFLCLFWRETRQRNLKTWNLAVSGSGKGTRRRVGWTKELQAVDDGTADESKLATGQQRGGTANRVGVEPRTGQSTPTPETVAEKRGSSHSEEDWVKRCRHSSACGIFASNPR